MTRWAFVRGETVRLSRAGDTMPDAAQTRALLFGDTPGDAPPLDGEGEWLPCPDGTGETCRFDGRAFLAPVDTAPRIVNGADFLGLFTPAEVAALWASGPEFMVAALRVASQNQANLDSGELHQLLALAVTRKALSPERLGRVAQGLPPA